MYCDDVLNVSVEEEPELSAVGNLQTELISVIGSVTNHERQGKLNIV